MEEKKSWMEFRTLISKAKEKRTHSIINSYGIRDAYIWLRKNKWLKLKKPISEHEFSQIIKTVNRHLAEKLLKGNTISLPYGMGDLEVQKYDLQFWIQDNKMRTNAPIDWDSTLRLWYEDEEARANKTLIRNEDKEHIKIVYKAWKATYKNKSFFKWYPNRDLKNELSKKFRRGNIDGIIKQSKHGMGKFIIS